MASKLRASRSKRRRTVSRWDLLTSVHAPFSDLARCAVNVAEGREPKPRQQRLQALADEVRAEVVQKDAREREFEVARPEASPPRRPRRIEPALVKLVRVEVEHRRALAGIDVVQRAEEETTRQQAKIAATGNGDAKPSDVPGG